MKILFLDIDGVLNSHASADWANRKFGKCNGGFNTKDPKFCPISCSNLITLLEDYPDLKIVVSSTWRLGEKVENLASMLEKYAEIPTGRVISKTPVIHDKDRGDEIKMWLDLNSSKYNIEKFVILDDDSDMSVVMEHLVQTDSRNGFTYTDMSAVGNKLDYPYIRTYGADLYRDKESGVIIAEGKDENNTVYYYKDIDKSILWGYRKEKDVYVYKYVGE